MRLDPTETLVRHAKTLYSILLDEISDASQIWFSTATYILQRMDDEVAALAHQIMA
jgi:hypothetical protein